jgi:Na+/H+ antiporter NhaD/arsenite permease-like protein
MIYANVIGSDLGRKSPRSAAWRRCCGCICWRAKASPSPGAYFKVGIVLTLPVLLITLPPWRCV